MWCGATSASPRPRGGSVVTSTRLHWQVHRLHRVGRVLSFSPVVGIDWDSPNPSPAGECAPPPLVPGGRGTLAGERWGGRVPIPTRGHTLWNSVYMYFVLCSFNKQRRPLVGFLLSRNCLEIVRLSSLFLPTLIYGTGKEKI
jgi:hypothetical protein